MALVQKARYSAGHSNLVISRVFERKPSEYEIPGIVNIGEFIYFIKALI